MTLPSSAGVSLKPEHFYDALDLPASDTWFEVHPENYMIGGGPRLRGLHAVRERFPLSFHGVGASLGGADLPDPKHIAALNDLIQQFEPASVSEHAVWSRFNSVYYADLLPLPRTEQAMSQLVNGIVCFQEGISRSILIENPTNYLPLISEMDESDFLVEVAQKAGCGLLVDINNLYISSVNCGIDPKKYLDNIPPSLVGEIHIAGFDLDPNLGERFLVDAHACAVDDEVWNLLTYALSLFGAKPVLLERDGNVPPLSDLMQEKSRADRLLKQAKSKGHNDVTA